MNEGPIRLRPLDVIDHEVAARTLRLAQLETRDPNVPSLNAALEAMGLKLEKTRGPRGYIVIDHIERPSPDGPGPARAAGAGLRR